MKDSVYKTSDFKETIIVKSYSNTTDTAGGTKPTYSNYLTTFAAVLPYDGDLFIEGGERVINNKYIFVLRYRAETAAINKSYKITYRNNDYIIHSVIDEGEDRYYTKIIAWRRN
jgi:SPP1 family predicted phage head-tail adaptor